MPLTRLPGAVPLETAADKGANFYAEISFADFAAAIVNTALILPLFTILGNAQGLELHHTELITPFANADGAFVSTAMTVGDAGSAARHLASTELNAAGTFVNLAYGTGTKYAPAANTVVTATITPTAAKNLALLTQGKVGLYFRLNDARQFQGTN